MYKLHSTCRACGAKSLLPVIDFGFQPLANDFQAAADARAGAAPLKVLYCPACTLAQLSVVVDPAVLYSNYPYVTSPSQTMLDHFASLLRDLEEERGGTLGKVLEIGSNDGALLKFLESNAESVTGVDPAANLVELAEAKGIQTHRTNWCSAVADLLDCTYDTIIARHVFAHCDDWWDFIKALHLVSHANTVVAIEVPYAGDLLDKNQFDTIYHEHLSYVNLRAVNSLLLETPFYLAKVIRYPIHGGAMLLILRWRTAGAVPVPSDSIDSERWRNLNGRAREMMQSLRSMVKVLGGSKSYRVCGYGASAKSTIWLNGCGFTHQDLAFVHDVTPQKQGKLCPGTDIPIIGDRASLETCTHAVLFAWNFAAEIIAKEEPLRRQGLKFIVPVPELKIIE